MENYSISVITDQFAGNPIKELPAYMHFQCIQTQIESIGQTPCVQTYDADVLLEGIQRTYGAVIALPVWLVREAQGLSLTAHSFGHQDTPIGYIFCIKGKYKTAMGIKSLTKSGQGIANKEMYLHLNRYNIYINNDVKMMLVETEGGYKNTVQNLYDLEDIRIASESFLNTLEQ